jgi:hypothetical protein
VLFNRKEGENLEFVNVIGLNRGVPLKLYFNELLLWIILFGKPCEKYYLFTLVLKRALKKKK